MAALRSTAPTTRTWQHVTWRVRRPFLSHSFHASQPVRTTLAAFRIPDIKNEANQHYVKGSAERRALATAIHEYKSQAPIEISSVATGRVTKTQPDIEQSNPSDHASPVAKYSATSASDVAIAIDAALAAKPAWESLPFVDRAAIFLKAADLISTKYRYQVMAATMLGQGKNAWQAEIDSAAELIDFLRFNVRFAEELHATQPVHNAPGVWNRSEYRPLEGFVYAVSPFNFTAIGGNLAAAPALMGNVVIWKPSPSAVFSNYLLHQIFTEAGLPPGVIQFVPGDAEEITKVCLNHPQFGALHYTGSTAVFRKLYGEIGQGIAQARYRGYPRIVGETGGKNSHTVHKSADVKNAAAQTVRAAFEYQGQKCSACSRAYIPSSIWPEFKVEIIKQTEALKVGPPEDFGNFIGPVIHRGSFEKLAGVIDQAKSDKQLELITGGRYDSSQGWFVHPTIFETKDPYHQNMVTEFFGPILTVYVYDDARPGAFEDILEVVDSTSEYGLTGAVFARDRNAIRVAEEALRHTAGNFYINGKCTGAVVGQQPFGGARSSGTNDKAGSAAILSRFVSQRSIKEDFVPISQVVYPSNEA